MGEYGGGEAACEPRIGVTKCLEVEPQHGSHGVQGVERGMPRPGAGEAQPPSHSLASVVRPLLAEATELHSSRSQWQAPRLLTGHARAGGGAVMGDVDTTWGRVDPALGGLDPDSWPADSRGVAHGRGRLVEGWIWGGGKGGRLRR